MIPYYDLDRMVTFIEQPNGEACRKILADNRKLFQQVQGSTNNHQAWAGGYFDHIQEVMNIAILLCDSMSETRDLPFTESDALLIMFLHDIEKPWKYELRDGQLHHIPSLETKAQAHEFRAKKLKEYGIVLTEDQQNALRYVEGELDEYSPRTRVMSPLAALCHMADVASARIWFDYPKESERKRD